MESSDEEHVVLENGLLKFLLVDAESIREEWVNEYYLDREEQGEYARIFPDLLKQPEKFFEYFRMMPETFYYILKKIDTKLCKQSNFRKCVSPEEKLMVTLRFLSTGLAFRSMAFSFKLAHNTVRAIVYETCEAIWKCFVGDHMPAPTTESFKSSADEFMATWGFPNCVGCIDGKHVRVRCPTHSGSMFYNYKQFFSVILQGVADAKCRFQCIDVGGYGRQSDGGVFQASPLYQKLEEGSLMPGKKPIPYSPTIPTSPIPHVILGDQGYPLKKYLLRPYPRKNATQNQELFNYKLSSVRRVVECAFGIAVSKWRVLKTEIQCSPDEFESIVKCACILHNIVIDIEGSAEVDRYLAEVSTSINTYLPNPDIRRYNRGTKKVIKSEMPLSTTSTVPSKDMTELQCLIFISLRR